MVLTPLKIKDAYLVKLNANVDDRGAFTRLWCQKALADLGIDSHPVQINLSHNRRKGTLRGLHYQRPPYQETKFICCLRGKLYDVMIDLRPASATYKQSLAVELNKHVLQALIVPQGCAHGFQTLEDNTDLIYAVDASYHPECERGIRWNDPSFTIAWPIAVTELSAKDRHYPDWCEDN